MASASAKNCRRTAELISLSMDRPLTKWERVVLLSHTVPCIACRRFGKHLRLIREFLREESAAPQRLSDEARQRIRRALDHGM